MKTLIILFVIIAATAAGTHSEAKSPAKQPQTHLKIDFRGFVLEDAARNDNPFNEAKKLSRLPAQNPLMQNGVNFGEFIIKDSTLYLPENKKNEEVENNVFRSTSTSKNRQVETSENR